MNLSTHPPRATPSKAATFRKDKEFLRLPFDSVTSSQSTTARKQDIPTTANSGWTYQSAKSDHLGSPGLRPDDHFPQDASRDQNGDKGEAAPHPTSTKAGNGSMLVDFTVPVWLPKVKCCEQGDFARTRH